MKTWSTETASTRENFSLRRFFRQERADSRPGSSSPSSIFWPQHLLAEEIPHVRILSYGYEAEIVRAFAPVGDANIFQHAQNLLAEIQGVRSEVLAPTPVVNCSERCRSLNVPSSSFVTASVVSSSKRLFDYRGLRGTSLT